jgi:hypothetical protein
METGICGNKIPLTIIKGEVILPIQVYNNTSKYDKREITTIVIAQ